MEDIICVDPSLLAKWNVSVPRYTSYPTAPQFYPVEESLYLRRFALFDASAKPLSIYIHIPFCKTMCLFCGCSVILNRSEEKQNSYLDLLLQEIALAPFAKKREVSQLHFGGGTPTSLNEAQFDRLMQALQDKFFFSQDAEISIEVDPRTVFADEGRKLRHLRSLGFNRISFGVQDLDPIVQEAVRRRQTEEMTVATYAFAKEAGFHGINLDLIYGLPHQSRKSFAKTIEKINELKPDRISLFSYAKVPWLKPHQMAIPETSLPSDLEKFGIYTDAREQLMKGGYEAIGMDHFSLYEDPLSIAYREKKIMRNFQGYSLSLACDMIGFGVTSIGFLEGAYFQNEKTIPEYARAIQRGSLPVDRGFVLQEEDLLRYWVIQKIMCHFAVDKGEFQSRYQIPFDRYFQKERQAIDRFVEEGLVEETEEILKATSLGRLLIRLIAAVFDAYIKGKNYSKVV